MSRQSPTSLAVLAAVLLGSAVSTPRVGHAQQPDRTQLAAELGRLYELGESVRTRSEAKRQYEKLQRMAPGNGDVVYAYALLQLDQHGYSDASQLLEKAVRLNPENLEARQLIVWLSVLKRDYAKAWADMERLVQALPDEANDELDEMRYLQAVRLLGRLVGYMQELDEHVGSRVFQEQAAQRITVKLGSRRRTAFDEGRAAVRERFAEQSQENEQMRQRAIEESLAQREKVLSELQKQLQDVVAALAPMESQHKEVMRQRQSELEAIDVQRRDVEATARGLQARRLGLVQEIRDLEDTIIELETLAEDPDIETIERLRMLDEAAAWRRVRSQRLAELNRVEANLTTLGAQLENLRRDREQVEGRFQKVFRAIEQLRRKKSSLETEITLTANKKVSGNTGRVRAHAKQALALTHYVAMPVEPKSRMQAILDQMRSEP